MKQILPIALSALILFGACGKQFENRGQWITTNIYNYDASSFNISYTDSSINAVSKTPSFQSMSITVATRFTGPGKYMVTDFGERYSSSPVYVAGREALIPPAGTVTIYYFGGVGDYVMGSFMVPSHWDQSDTSGESLVRISGTFQVRRME